MTLFGIPEAIREGEAHLKRSLETAEGSPFLAHHEVPDRASLLEAVREYVQGSSDALRDLFRTAPRVSVWVVATTLSKRYASQGDRHCYRPIGTAFGFKSIESQKERKALRRAFRRAVTRLGLALPSEDELVQEGRGENLRATPVDDYFLQAGVPFSQFRHLVQMFHQGQEAFGPPPTESSQALSRWERDCVLEFRPPGVNRAPKVLLFDRTGFHASRFGAILDGMDPGDSLSRELRNAWEEERGRLDSRARPRIAAPRLHCIDGALVIRDSYGRGGFEAEIDGTRYRIAPGQTLPLPTPWPKEVICQPPNAETERRSPVEVLPEGIDVVLFDAESGRLESAVGFGGDAPTVAFVRRGEIAAASRRPFSIDGDEAIEFEDECFLKYVEADRTLELTASGGSILVKPRAEASLRIVGRGAVARFGTASLVAGIRAVEVHYPLEAEDEGQVDLELHLSHPALGDTAVVLPFVTPPGGGTSSIDIEEKLPSTGVLGRLRVALVAAGGRRNLCVESAWLWPGLESFDEGQTFLCSSVPENLDLDRSLHVTRQGLSVFLDEPTATPYIEARLIFRRLDDQAEEDPAPLADFRLPPPGVSIIQRDSTGAITPIRRGRQLALAPADGSTLEIRTPDAQGELDVKGEMYAINRYGRWQMSSTGVLRSGHGKRGHSLIRYRGPCTRMRWIDLVRITEVHEVQAFEVKPRTSWTAVEATLSAKPQGLRVEIQGLQTTCTTALEQDDLTILHRGEREISVTILHDRLPRPDLYLAWLTVDFGDGRWRELTNRRGDSYRWVIPHFPNGDVRSLHHEKPVEGYLTRLSSVLLDCAAAECWPSIERHLVPKWRAELEASSSDSGSILRESVRDWPRRASGTWVPILHPLAVRKTVFSAPVKCFADIDIDESMDGASHIRILHRFADCGSVAEAVENLNITPFVTIAFQNAKEVDRDPSLKLTGFKFARYLSAMHHIPADDRESLWTERKPRLTPSHHLWCMERFARRLGAVASGGNNRSRILRAASFCERARPTGFGEPQGPDFALPAPEHLSQEFEIGPDTEPERSPRGLFQLAPHLLSSLAHHSRCRKISVRTRPANLWRDYDEGDWLAESLGFVIRLAPELFGFYLMLWELATIPHRPTRSSDNPVPSLPR